jgi:hypothetical protein
MKKRGAGAPTGCYNAASLSTGSLSACTMRYVPQFGQGSSVMPLGVEHGEVIQPYLVDIVL